MCTKVPYKWLNHWWRKCIRCRFIYIYVYIYILRFLEMSAQCFLPLLLLLCRKLSFYGRKDWPKAPLGLFHWKSKDNRRLYRAIGTSRSLQGYLSHHPYIYIYIYMYGEHPYVKPAWYWTEKVMFVSLLVCLCLFLFACLIFVGIWRRHVIKWKHFPRYRPFVRGIHRSPVNSPHKGQWRGALMFSLICSWLNDFHVTYYAVPL